MQKRECVSKNYVANENMESKIWVTKDKKTYIIPILTRSCNCYLISNGTQRILVDTGIKYEEECLIKCLEQLEVTHLDAVVLTHSHFDHAGNVELIRNMFHCDILIHKKEKIFLERGLSRVPKGTVYFTEKISNCLEQKRLRLFQYDSCYRIRGIEDGFDLMEYGIAATILSTPGHTKGSISILVGGEIALVGDTILGGIHKKRYLAFAENVDEGKESLKRLLLTGCWIFLPAHGLPITRKQVRTKYNKKYRKKVYRRKR